MLLDLVLVEGQLEHFRVACIALQTVGGRVHKDSFQIWIEKLSGESVEHNYHYYCVHYHHCNVQSREDVSEH